MERIGQHDLIDCTTPLAVCITTRSGTRELKHWAVVWQTTAPCRHSRQSPLRSLSASSPNTPHTHTHSYTHKQTQTHTCMLTSDTHASCPHINTWSVHLPYARLLGLSRMMALGAGFRASEWVGRQGCEPVGQLMMVGCGWLSVDDGGCGMCVSGTDWPPA